MLPLTRAVRRSRSTSSARQGGPSLHRRQRRDTPSVGRGLQTPQNSARTNHLPSSVYSERAAAQGQPVRGTVPWRAWGLAALAKNQFLWCRRVVCSRGTRSTTTQFSLRAPCSRSRVCMVLPCPSSRRAACSQNRDCTTLRSPLSRRAACSQKVPRQTSGWGVRLRYSMRGCLASPATRT